MDNQNTNISDLPKSDHDYRFKHEDKSWQIGIEIYPVGEDLSHKVYRLYKYDSENLSSKPFGNSYNSLSEALKAENDYIETEIEKGTNRPEYIQREGSPAERIQKEKPEKAEDTILQHNEDKKKTDRVDTKAPEQEGRNSDSENPKPKIEIEQNTRGNLQKPPEEKENSFIKELLLGDFYGGDPSLVGTASGVGVGMIPIVGQIADARDTISAIIGVWNNPSSFGNWGNLGLAAVGWVPLIGDAIKSAKKGKAALDISEELVSKVDDQIIRAEKSLDKGSNSAPSFISNNKTYRDKLERFLKKNKDHPLSKLINDKKGWHKGPKIGNNRSYQMNHPELIEIGHVVSKKTGSKEVVVVMTKFRNQFLNDTIEKRHKGGWVEGGFQVAIIEGIAVELESAKDFVKADIITSLDLAKATISNADELL